MAVAESSGRLVRVAIGVEDSFKEIPSGLFLWRRVLGPLDIWFGLLIGRSGRGFARRFSGHPALVVRFGFDIGAGIAMVHLHPFGGRFVGTI